jgi:hypothetical protein
VRGASRFHQAMKRRAVLTGLAASFVASSALAVTTPLPDVDCTYTVLDDVPKQLYPLLDQWIEKSAHAVRRYYGKFPVPVLDLEIHAHDGSGVEGGRSEPGARPLIRAFVGVNSKPDQLLIDDWVMVHEMIHMAIPYVPRRHFWWAEGLAVYVESIARMHVDHVKPELAWFDFIKRMPSGLPQGKEGLAQSRNHGRVYWGGALFCLMADVRIRQETSTHIGLREALRGINATMDFRQEMDVLPVLKEGDKATGTKVLQNLYAEMAVKGGAPDLSKLWADLGVAERDGKAVFDHKAPLANIRRAINEGKA